MPTRRQVIKWTFWGAAAVALVRLLHGPFKSAPQIPEDPDYDYYFLTGRDRTLIAAISPAMLAGALPKGREERKLAVLEIVRGVDLTIAGLAPSVQEELRDLFYLMDFPVIRRFLSGVWKPWLRAEEHEIDRFLLNWQRSRLSLLRSAYQGFHEIIMASWYGNQRSWNGIGYDGPPAL
jgi:hypothetical protein